MMPRALRLSREGFSVLGSARRGQSPHFSVSYTPAASDGGCAAVISKKVAPRSVDRHLLKRRILSVVKPWCSSKSALVVFAKAGTLTLSFPALKEELSTLLAPLPRS